MRLRMGVVSAVLWVGVTGCSNQTNLRVETRLNQAAALTGNLPSNPLQSRVITSWINKQDSTMSTMFGNDAAVQYARANAQGKYPVGAVVSVVTWSQQEDPRWFGGKIPQEPQAVEFVTVNGPGAISYRRYEGSPLKQVASVEGSDPNGRASYLLAQRAAVMP